MESMDQTRQGKTKHKNRSVYKEQKYILRGQKEGGEADNKKSIER